MTKTIGQGKLRKWKVTYGGTVTILANSQEQLKDRFAYWYNNHNCQEKPKILKMEVIRE